VAEHDQVVASYRREMDVEEYTRIRQLYKAHSVAEDARDVPGLLRTLTSDCVYEIAHTGHRWTGHTGAARFYSELLGAFPDITFNLRHIVIGPQGVWEEADVHGTWQRFIIIATPQGPNNEGGPSSAPANGGGLPGKQDNFLHTNPYPNTASPGQDTRECEGANESYAIGKQSLGNVPGNQGTSTDKTTRSLK